MPALALLLRPGLLTMTLQPTTERSPTDQNLRFNPVASVPSFSPVTFSAQETSTSELLRTLLRMAASKPTYWLSGIPYFLYHLA
jgi:hypothetical protein